MFYKIPLNIQSNQVKSIPKKLHTIGIIDASGSMSSWWGSIADFWNSDVIPKENLRTITFDTKPHYLESNILSKKISQHGGGGTNIPEAFKMLEQKVQNIPIDEDITVIFISDGEDNNMDTIEKRFQKLNGNQSHKLNFICLGIQSGFPTFLSVRLRQIYHKGDDSIPALFLIEYMSEKALFNKFEGMRNYFYAANIVSIDPPVMLFPWNESVTDSVYEGSWVISKSDQLILNESIVVKVEKKALSIEDSVDLIKGWVQNLTMMSISQLEQAQKYSKMALEYMNDLLEDLNNTYGIKNLLTINQEEVNKGKTFPERAKLNYILKNGLRLQWFFNEIQQLLERKPGQKESEFEVAKRMNIGTITGKYSQKILSLKNITLDIFEQMKNNYLQNNEFLNQEFAEGLTLTKSQFDLMETLHFKGIALKVKRNEGFLESYSAFTVKEVDVDRVINLSELALNQFNINDGEINCILPLLDDEYYKNCAKHSLFQLIFSFIVTTNYDIFLEDAYLVLLSRVLVFAEKNKNQNLKEIVFKNLKIYIDSRPNLFLEIEQNFQEGKIKDQYDSGLLYLYLSYYSSFNNDKFSKKSVKDLSNILVLNYFIALIQKNTLISLIQTDFNWSIDDQVEDFKKKTLSFYYLGELRKELPKYICELVLSGKNSQITLNEGLVYAEEIGFVPLKNIEQYTEIQNLQNEYISFICHCNKYKGEKVFTMELVNDFTELKKIKSKTNGRISKQPFALRHLKKYPEFFLNMEKLYIENFRQNHKIINILSKQQIADICKEKGIDFDTLQFENDSNMCKNACVSINCPFFLKTSVNFKKHMGGWQGSIPQGFHRFIKSKANMEFEQIWQEAKQKWQQGFPEKYKVTEDFAKQYIEQIKQYYTQQ
ncbi:zinc-binding dehydrogenase family protein, putative [Ichthyophthirius multifiliis]|uniref:Zinc-binding dehydrogenase family protein, putative n=1 Tax=Ichthyophthirius multifiliis TaxID=5932 RepID=G0QSG9_ICHMU|nr:zinc-binding dehydrogenase family protein, putative [Ichthyophthirius multifiliis]EGR31807.1 zinc-binding dehydrogenase family protein, putative [Ichthyophthirius multifiliis]|eukprot:XP_004035293.1 zinc-binding dehydrogenase family protein, putative [Ichthyophthirius multifiliis]